MTPEDALARLLAAPIAHRGLHACGGAGPVENSISAARAAIAKGYGIECDVRLSRDGEAMVFHDAALGRLTGRDGDLADHDAEALAAIPLRGGPDTIPTLPAFLAAVAGRVPLVIEIKSDGEGDMRLAERAMALVAAYPGPVALESFDPRVVVHCRRAGAPCPVGLVGPLETGAPPEPSALAACQFLSWDVRQLDTLASGGLPLSAWTVRTRTDVATARRHGAQIVFEGFRPSSLSNERFPGEGDQATPSGS